MIIVIAPETNVKDEIRVLHQLFEAGLEYYHLRKPDFTYKQHAAYLKQIDISYHKRIVVHLFHELVQEFNLKGMHLQESERKNILKTQQLVDIRNAHDKSILISSSFHEPEDIISCDQGFDYHLLSPVFNSISKNGYRGRGFNVNHIYKKIIGIGGVTSENLKTIKNLGYYGVGVLGGIWNQNVPFEAFKEIQLNFE